MIVSVEYLILSVNVDIQNFHFTFIRNVSV